LTKRDKKGHSEAKLVLSRKKEDLVEARGRERHGPFRAEGYTTICSVQEGLEDGGEGDFKLLTNGEKKEDKKFRPHAGGQKGTPKMLSTSP